MRGYDVHSKDGPYLSKARKVIETLLKQTASSGSDVSKMGSTAERDRLFETSFELLLKKLFYGVDRDELDRRRVGDLGYQHISDLISEYEVTNGERAKKRRKTQLEVTQLEEFNIEELLL